MAHVPDECFMDAKTELLSEKGVIKHAALTLYGYYCVRRNKQTGLCFQKTARAARDTGIPRTNVIQLQDFLEDRGWIWVYRSGVIRPLKGFYPAEKILTARFWRPLLETENCLTVRQNCLIFRQICLIFRQLFKGSINQPLEPAILTSFSAEKISADKKIDIPKKDLSPERAETKSAGKINERNGLSPERAETKPKVGNDERRDHPAILMVRRISGRFPHKDQWDKIIREIGDNPDIEFFQASWEIWRSFDGKPTNLQGWLFKPKITGKLPEVFGKPEELPANGESPPETEDWQIENETPEAEPLTFETRQNALVILRGMLRSSKLEDLQFLKRYYTEEDWEWLISELQK